jgi:hypothetical protein
LDNKTTTYIRIRAQKVLGEDADFALLVTNLMSAVAAANQLNLTLIETTSRLERIRTKLEAIKEGNKVVFHG